MDFTKLAIFTAFWPIIFYLLNSIIAGSFKKIEPKQALVYFMTVALIGVFGEIFLDTAYNFFVGTPLWRYNILPIHGGYTSAYAPIIWGTYGLHLYLLHDTLAKRWSIKNSWLLVLLFSFEALLIESIVTISSRLYLGEYMYYYFPGDLWHVTSIQNMPFYFICGMVILKTIKRFKTDPVFFSAMSAALIIVIVFFA